MAPDREENRHSVSKIQENGKFCGDRMFGMNERW